MTSPPPAQPVVVVQQIPLKSPGLAVTLELVPGFLFQTFGFGHIYAGNYAVGILMMFGYWMLTAINVALCFVFIGFITWPLTWLAAMAICSITAGEAATQSNRRIQHHAANIHHHPHIV